MDPQVKEDWVEALRSDEYVQGKDYLCKDNKHCCLGVLCEITDTDVVAKSINGGTIYAYKGETNTALLSENLKEEIGLADDDVDELIFLNDTQEVTFDEIADYIEVYL